MKAVKKSAKTRVWTGRKNVVVEGTREPLIVDGVQPKYTNREGRSLWTAANN